MKKSILEITGLDDQDMVVDMIKLKLFKDREPLQGQIELVISICENYNINPVLGELYILYKEGDFDIYPTLTVDGWYKLVNDHPEYDGCEFFESDAQEEIDVPLGAPFYTTKPTVKGYSSIGCKMYRKNQKHAPTIKEYLSEVFNPNDCTWYTHTNRRLRHKAFVQAARVVFNLSGVYESDEIDNVNSLHNHVGTTKTENDLDFEVVNLDEDHQSAEPQQEAEAAQEEKVVVETETSKEEEVNQDTETSKEEEVNQGVEVIQEAEVAKEEKVDISSNFASQVNSYLKNALHKGDIDTCAEYLISNSSPEYKPYIEEKARELKEAS